MLEVLPEYDEQQSLSERFRYISQMNSFRSVLAQHEIKERKDDLCITHDDHKDQVERMFDYVREENSHLHQ